MAKEEKFVCGRCPWACVVHSSRRPTLPPHTCLNGMKPFWTHIGGRK